MRRAICSKLPFGPAVMLTLLVGCTPMSKHPHEIATPDLPYIAKIRTDRAEASFVAYHSEICARIGAACGFFRSHAFAHRQLNHPILSPEQYPQSMERDADCWAARMAPAGEVAAAVRLLEDAEARQGLPITGDPDARAGHIRGCAVQAGNWPEDSRADAGQH